MADTAPALETDPAIVHRSQLGSVLILVAIATLWFYGWAGNFVLTLQLGRYDNQALNAAVLTTPLVSAIFQALMYGTILALMAAIVVSLKAANTPPLHLLIALLGPWVVLYPLFFVVRGIEFARQDTLFPLVVTAIYFVRPAIGQIARLIAALATISASASVAIGLFASSVALMPPSWDEGKAFIGSSALAGIYGHSNHLGTMLALSVPFIICVYKGAKRNICLAIIVAALIWSASRASLASVAAFCVLALMLGENGLPRRRNRNSAFLLAAIFAGISIAIWLPLATADPTAYSNRGRIWQASVEFWSRSPWMGWGADVLRKRSELTLYIDAIPRSSHNVWLTFATAGGLLALIALVIAGATVTLRAVAMYRAGEALPLLFVFMLVLLSIAEDPVGVLHAQPQSFLVWPALAFMFCIPRRSPCAIEERVGEETNVANEMLRGRK